MKDAVRGLLSGFPVVVPNLVSWAEMDALGHVNNAVYFRYFENARIDYLVRIGLGTAREDGIGPILHSTQARFRRPLHHPDTAWTGARVVEPPAADRFVMEYRIVSDQQGAVVAEGGATVVAFDYTARAKADLPPAVADAIRQLERWTAG